MKLVLNLVSKKREKEKTQRSEWIEVLDVRVL